MKKVLFGFMLAAAISGSSRAQQLIRSIDGAHTGEALSVSVSSDALTILTGGSDKRANLLNVKTGDKVKSFAHSEKVNTVAFSANGKLFVTGSADGKLILMDAREGKPKFIMREHTGEISSAAFNPLNDFIASGSRDNTAKIWDPKSNKSVFTLRGHTKSVNAVAFSPDGLYLATGSADNTVRIWEVSNGNLKNTLSCDAKEVISLAYSSDGRFLACGGSNGSVTLWEAPTGNQLAQLKEFKSAAMSVTFSPDVQYIAAAGEDGKVVIWNTETQKLANKFNAHEKNTSCLVFSDKGSLMLTSGMEGSIKIWDVSELKIGNKKYVKDNLPPKLTCSAVMLKDDNGNGIIDRGEKSSLNFTVKNQGEGQAYNIVAKVELATAVSGLEFDREVLIGNLEKGKSLNIIIPVTTTDDIESASGIFQISLTEANGHNSAPAKLSFQTRGEKTYSYIMVTSYQYSSATGKAEIGAPITLKLRLKNKSGNDAKNLKVNFSLPKNVLAVDRLSELIETLPAYGEKEVSVQFYADKEFTGTEFKIGMDIDGASFSNVSDLKMVLKMNEKLPETDGITAPVYDMAVNNAPGSQDNSENKPLMRGSADPLKGLNVSKAKSMQIGDYYALIIGIDKYQGTWAPLNNAVNDAKAVENLLKSEYKFDQFRTLYDQQATRENIIKEMEWLVNNVKEKDNVFIYYSGHGEYKQTLNKGYWVPVDAQSTSTSNYISNSDIQTFLAGIKSKHTLLVSDACFSGDIFRGNTVSIPFEDSEKYFTEVHNLSSRQAITSGGVEPVMDGGKDGHSVFAYYFLKSLKSNSSKYLDASQLYNNIKVPVINNSDQSPKLSPIKNTGDEGGQFIFIKKNAAVKK
jgi:WD40 repeat protein